MLTLILGGARSGKSRYAQKLCESLEPVIYLATAPRDELDAEMTRRIARHQTTRPAHWQTIEESIEVVRAIQTATPANAVIIIDCITLWLSNLMWKHREKNIDEAQTAILAEIAALARIANERAIIAVSNEVGSGIVPLNEVGREFRDRQGLTNQMLASAASRVVLVVAGLPLTLKPAR